MRRTLTSWLVVFALLAAGFGATVLALNNDVFSAHGFVRSYLQALARHDSAEALAFAGVDVPEGAGTTLLVDGALGEVRDIQFIGESSKDGITTVRFEYTLSSGTQRSEFHVEHAGSRFALFDAWRFVDAPIALLTVTVDNDSRFEANGVESTAGTPEAVLIPSIYVIDHSTEYLEAEAVEVSAIEPGGSLDAQLAVTPTPAFGAAAEDAIAAFLDTCASQQVLMPTGCPFGFVEANRLDGAPEWAMTAYPTATLSSGPQPNTWTATGAGGAVQLTATVRSLFDGSTSTLDESITVAGSYTLSIGADNSVSVLAAQS